MIYETRVALLAEGVDRNPGFGWFCRCGFPVALLAEGVDRNRLTEWLPSLPLVALLAEGVDRNINSFLRFILKGRRPPRGGRG